MRLKIGRGVVVLATCQALSMTSTTIMITVSALTGEALAVDDTLATLPLGLQFVATMLATIPASLLMKRVGRRAGFAVGALVGAAGGVVAMLASLGGSFLLFCLGNAMVGAAMGFAQFYRFAAAEAVGEGERARAIAWVLSGGVAAAILGPLLARSSRTLFPAAPFAGCFVIIALLFLAAALILRLVSLPRPSEPAHRAAGRPLAAIVRQPIFLVAALAGMVGYGVMSLVMTATPLAMMGHAHDFADAAFVIQWHALGMFAPSFFTGELIRRWGVLNILLAGALLVSLCIAINLAGTGLLEFWSALLLLGLGWNFLYIGATTLLTEAYRPEERAKVQALNDFLIFGLVALSSFSSGALYGWFGWATVNAAAVLPLTAVFLAALWLRGRRRTPIPLAR